jgi:membrane-associated phospholipid phosphatase
MITSLIVAAVLALACIVPIAILIVVITGIVGLSRIDEKQDDDHA